MEKKQGERYLEFKFDENELIGYLREFKSKCESGEIENAEDIAEFVMD